MWRNYKIKYGFNFELKYLRTALIFNYKTTKQNDTGHLALELPNFIEVIDWHLVFHKYIDIKDYPTGT